MSAIAKSGASSAPSVLIIDDDKPVVLSLQAVLEDAGFRVLTACNGLAGVDAFKKHAPPVVITDIIMPDQDGLATIMQIRRLRPHAKIIAMSGGGRIGNTDFLSVAGKLGADAILPKPFSGDEPVVVIDQLLRDETVAAAMRAVA